MNQGDIFWIEFPFSNLAARKLRPAMILSSASYNKYANVLMAGIYSKTQPLSIRITNHDLMDKQMQKTASYISLQNVISVEKTLIRQRVDTLTAKKLQQVLSTFEKHIRS